MVPLHQGAIGLPTIASFAPELIDAILDHLSCRTIHESVPRRGERESPKSPPLRELEKCSLISRIWRGPAQRRIFKCLAIKLAAQAERVIEGFGATGLQHLVKNLQLKFAKVLPSWGLFYDPGAEYLARLDAANLDHFVAPVPIFPALSSLEFESIYTNLQDRYYEILEASGVLHGLTHLRIKTRDWHQDVDVIHGLLSLTPNLESLSLDSWDDKSPKSRNPKSPAHLPHLTHLEVSGQYYPAFLVDLGLLSPSTFSQITSLDWDEESYAQVSWDQGLLRLVGPQLHTLSYCTWSSNRDIAAELALCPVVETLSLRLECGGERLISSIPSTTQSLTLFNSYTAHDFLADLTPETRPAALQTVILDAELGRYQDNHYEERWEEQAEEEQNDLEEIAEACKRAGVELVLVNEDMRDLIQGSD